MFFTHILIYRSSPAKYKERFTFNFVDFSTHQMNYILAKLPNLTTISFLYGKLIKQVKVFMIAVNKQSNGGLGHVLSRT